MLNQFIIFYAQYLYLVIAGIGFFFLLFSDRSIKKGVLAVGAVSVAIALVADKIFNQLIESPRPFLSEGVVALFPHVASNGFPSEHVLFAIVIAGTIFIFNKKLGGFLAVLGLVVGCARVLANVHHPVDILGGTVVGIASVSASWLIVSRFSNRVFVEKEALE